MTAERLKKPLQPEIFTTAGFGSVAPTWIKADLVTPPIPTESQKPQPPHWQWLKRQLGWQQS